MAHDLNLSIEIVVCIPVERFYPPVYFIFAAAYAFPVVEKLEFSDQNFFARFKHSHFFTVIAHEKVMWVRVQRDCMMKK